MCNCFYKMIEKGYAEQHCIYNETTKNYEKKDRFWIKLSKVNLTVNYCPICGEKISPVSR
jgi:hypothetical protein